MDILVIPDVHGRTFWRYALEHIDDYDKVVFLGDYLDPYGHEKITWEMAVEQFKDILKFREDYPDKVVLICGNHDLHYIVNEDLFCSRYNHKKSEIVHQLYKSSIFKIAYIVDDCLFTHAGVTKDWLNRNNLTVQNLLDNTPESIVHELCSVGFLRGGWADSGSCVWCDVREFLNTDHDLGYFQIFGHTQLKEMVIHPKEFACTDCHKCFKLNTETKELIYI